MAFSVLITFLNQRCLPQMWSVVVEVGPGDVLLVCDRWVEVAGQRCKVGPVGLGA